MTSGPRKPLALVTGGARGIGRATASVLATDGYHVIVNDLDGTACGEAVQALQDAGHTADAWVCDLTDSAAVSDGLQALASAHGGLAVLIANAGMMSSGLTVERTQVDEVQQLLAVHCLANFTLYRSVVPLMRAQGSGCIIAVSSVAASRPSKCAAPYSLSKAALESMTLCLADEVREHGLRVNIVAPGITDTRLGREFGRRAFRSEELWAHSGTSRFGRFGMPADVASVIGFLCSDAARHIHAQRIVVDGG